jgi:hypothetical protein
MSKETTSQITCPGPGRQNSPAERGQFSHGADTPDVPGPPGSPRMSLHDMQATSATTLTPSHLRTADVHPRNTSGLDREGIARAQQLAALALRDTSRQRLAEAAFTSCVADPLLTRRLIGRGLCHGTAGLLATARRIAADAITPMSITPIEDLYRQTAPAKDEPAGLLDGKAGSDLAATGTTRTSWDACLLLA